MGIPLINAELLALFFETFAYGIYLLLSCFTIPVLIGKRTAVARTGKILLPVAILMLVIATTHIIIDFYRAYTVFAGVRFQSFESGTAYYEIWRCYVVFSKRISVVIPPVLVMIPAFIALIIVLRTWKTATPGTPIFSTATQWITAYFVMTMCINIYCTGMSSMAPTIALFSDVACTFVFGTALIAWRIYQTGKFRAGLSSMMPVIIVLIESGALYTSSVIAMLCTYLAGSNGQYPALDLITPLVGIVFCLIILQIRYHFNSSTMSGRSGSSRPEWAQQNNISGPAYPMAPLAIEITTHTEEYLSHSRDLESEGKPKAIEAGSDSSM
ncbi:hypothetical protein EW146_g5706 [Bondarzewia mesenterica]|uniref:Uncharacterized protein n=1 Tax=Bondarzewia mesenterica TaxID=1095465 RepID=A0A4S4LQN9_9AGAM|nr:hypothetical protein EW146_g5706 [Bondarzewia mesenterica]